MPWTPNYGDADWERAERAIDYVYRKWLREPVIKRILADLDIAAGEAAEEKLASGISQLRNSSLLMGAGDLVLTGGVPLAVWVGVFVALGAPYAQAKELIKQENFVSGFSQGFVIGLLKWEWTQAVSRFFMFAPIQNTVNPGFGYTAANAHNDGLRSGYIHASILPDGVRQGALKRVRSFSRNVHAGTWTRNDQVRYVIELAAGARGHGFFRN